MLTQRAPKPVVSATKPAPKRATFTAVGGEDCIHTASKGYYVIGNDRRWFKKKTGGWNKDGCKGTYRAMPKSNDPNRDDPRKFVVWWFKTGAVKSGSCRTWLYIPNTIDSDGKPAFYQIIRGRDDQRVTADFRIDQTQTQTRGRWAFAGNFRMSNGEFAVKARNRGSKAAWGTHITVAQVKVSCVAG